MTDTPSADARCFMCIDADEQCKACATGDNSFRPTTRSTIASPAELTTHSPSPYLEKAKAAVDTEAMKLREVIAMLRERDGQNYDGEVHLTSEEGSRIAAMLERLAASDTEAMKLLRELRELVDQGTDPSDRHPFIDDALARIDAALTKGDAT